MNAIITTPTEVALPFVEILDAEGNPTGEFRLDDRHGEAAPEGTEVYTSAEDGEHAVTVN